MQKLYLLGILFLFISVHVHGQEQVLYQAENLEFENISVDSALAMIEKQTNLHFTYNSDLLKATENITANFKNVPLCIILDSLFDNPNLNYQIIERQLVVYEQENVNVLDSIAKLGNESLSQRLAIAGEVRDKETGESLAFATVSIKNSIIGTISNEDGKFSLKYKNPGLYDTLLISYLGYESLSLPLNSLPKYHVYQLVTKSISLHEVIVRSVLPKSLVLQAIEKRKENYPNHSYVQRAFYREAVKRDKKYMLYSEGLLDVLKRSYRPSLFKEQVKLIKQRSFKSISQEDTVNFKLHGGIQTSLDLDVVKHSFDFIALNKIDTYEYAMRDMVLYNDKLSYMLEFKPKDAKNPMAYEGYIYIDVESLAFVKFEFKYTKFALHKMRNAFIIRKTSRLIIIPQNAEYSVSYKIFNGKYYINHLQGELSLKVKKKRKFLSSKYSASFEMVATEIDANAPRRFAADSTMKTNTVFFDISPNYDINFWGNENFLLPEYSLMQAFESLSLEK